MRRDLPLAVIPSGMGWLERLHPLRDRSTVSFIDTVSDAKNHSRLVLLTLALRREMSIELRGFPIWNPLGGEAML